MTVQAVSGCWGVTTLTGWASRNSEVCLELLGCSFPESGLVFGFSVMWLPLNHPWSCKQPQRTYCITRLDLVGIVPLTPYMGWIDVRWHLVRNASKFLMISKTSTEGLWWLLPPCSDKICTRWSFYKSDQKIIIIPKTATAYLKKINWNFHIYWTGNYKGDDKDYFKMVKNIIQKLSTRMREMSQQVRVLPPSLMSWIRSLGPTQWRERAISHKLFSDINTGAMVCPLICAYCLNK